MSEKSLKVIDELRRFCPSVVEALTNGSPIPESSHGNPSDSDDEAVCRQLATSHYENFPLIAGLLPRHLRQPFFNVYAFCRWSDDLADEVGDRDLSTRLLAWWRSELHACFDDRPVRHPVLRALRRTVQNFDLSQQPFDDLLTAFEQDQRVLQYECFDELLGYCRNSANPVGRIVLRLCRCDDARSVELSDSVCTGLQLANFWQDVARDADIGRTYLPLEDCERFGYSRPDLANRETNEAFLKLMQFEVQRAREYLLAVRELSPRLQGRLQVAIDLFGEGGLKICNRIAEIGYRVWDQRPVVTKFDALGLFVRCLFRCVWRLGRRSHFKTSFSQSHRPASTPTTKVVE